VKHVFVVNPAAGKGKVLELIKPKIEAVCKQDDLDYAIHVTTGPYEGMDYVRQMASSGARLRFYACGGDGTIYEVVNGMWDAPNAEFAAIPLGSGNDFVRLFGGKELFLELEKVVHGDVVTLDIIRCGDQIAVNQCSMGFDAEVCAKQASYKKLPGMPGDAAYIAAIFGCVLRRTLGYPFQIEIDGKKIDNGEMMLCVAGNSRWYGGGFMAAPRAMPDDGLLDIVMIEKKGNRFKLLLDIFPKLRKGEHLDYPLTKFIRGKEVHIKSAEPAAVNVDGETKYVTEATFTLLEQAIRFVIPQGSPFFKTREEWEKKEVML